MQERIKELAVEAGAGKGSSGRWLMTDDELQEVAQAVARECAEICDGMPYRAAGAGKASQSIRVRFGLGE